MSRAEKYIQEHTRNCFNYNSYAQTPEPWLTPDQARTVVEIAREEVIEKVCEFLGNDLCCYIKAQDFAIEHQRLENDLKKLSKEMSKVIVKNGERYERLV